MARVSVLTSVYNGEKYLKEAIESILSQTFSDFEFIIVNDNSTDSSLEIIKSFKDDRINLVENKENLGLTKSLNKGLKLAKGDYIARMDADDISEPTRFEKQVKVLEENPEYTVVGSNMVLINENGEILEDMIYPQTPEENLGNIFFANTIVHSSAMFRREFVLKLGGYNEEYKKSQDYDLWLSIIENGGQLYNIQEYLLKYRTHSDSITSKFGSEQEGTVVKILQKRLKSILGVDAKEKDLTTFRHSKGIKFFQKYTLMRFLTKTNAAFREKFKEYTYAQDIFFHNSLGLLEDDYFKNNFKKSLVKK